MIDLYSSPTPNGRKISIMLEELGVDFNPIKINLHDYPNVLRWYKQISTRPAVIKGYNSVGEFYEIPKP